MKSSPLYLIPPLIALLVLLSSWDKNRQANAHLEELHKRAGQLEQALAKPRPTPVTPASYAAPIESPVASSPEEDEEAEERAEELPPIVVPGTVEELATSAAGLIARMIELQSAFGDEEPEPGTPGFEAEVAAIAEVMGAMTPIAAGFQILREELQDPVLAGRLLGNIVGQTLSLDEAKTARLGEFIGGLRAEAANGRDPQALEGAFFSGLERYLSPAETAALLETFDPRFVALDLGSADAVFSALRCPPPLRKPQVLPTSPAWQARQSPGSSDRPDRSSHHLRPTRSLAAPL